MGCDIHTFTEKRVGGHWRAVCCEKPFDNRSYGLFGFLAGVRNYSDVPPISMPRGLPSDISEHTKDEYETWKHDAHSLSWLSTAELKAFDYDIEMEDRRVTRQTGSNSWNGGCTCEPGEGEVMTFRKFLGQSYFNDLDQMEMDGVERVVFWFDN